MLLFEILYSLKTLKKCFYHSFLKILSITAVYNIDMFLENQIKANNNCMCDESRQK